MIQKALWCINLCSSGEKLEQEVPEWSNNISERGEQFILTDPRFAVHASCIPGITDYCVKDRNQYAIYHLKGDMKFDLFPVFNNSQCVHKRKNIHARVNLLIFIFRQRS